MKKLVTGICIVLGSLIATSGSALVQAKDITIGQKNKTFVLEGNKIETISVNQGDTIHFANNDPWFHNIFSLSDLKTFDLGSYPEGESRPVTFDKKGTLEIECAIHPHMFLEVTVK